MGTQITVSSNAKAVLRTLKSFRVQTIEQLKDETEAILKRVMKIMTKEGSPSVTPVQWDSEKQRRFVLAKLRMEDNLPYQRSGDYVNNFKIERTDAGSMLKNSRPGAIFISGGAKGDRQSNIHKGRWPLLRDAVDIVMEKTPQYIYENLRKLIKRD
jgi:hypothetical protein